MTRLRSPTSSGSKRSARKARTCGTQDSLAAGWRTTRRPGRQRRWRRQRRWLRLGLLSRSGLIVRQPRPDGESEPLARVEARETGPSVRVDSGLAATCPATGWGVAPSPRLSRPRHPRARVDGPMAPTPSIDSPYWPGSSAPGGARPGLRRATRPAAARSACSAVAVAGGRSNGQMVRPRTYLLMVLLVGSGK